MTGQYWDDELGPTLFSYRYRLQTGEIRSFEVLCCLIYRLCTEDEVPLICSPTEPH